MIQKRKLTKAERKAFKAMAKKIKEKPFVSSGKCPNCGGSFVEIIDEEKTYCKTCGKTRKNDINPGLLWD